MSYSPPANGGQALSNRALCGRAAQVALARAIVTFCRNGGLTGEDNILSPTGEFAECGNENNLINHWVEVARSDGYIMPEGFDRYKFPPLVSNSTGEILSEYSMSVDNAPNYVQGNDGRYGWETLDIASVKKSAFYSKMTMNIGRVERFYDRPECYSQYELAGCRIDTTLPKWTPFRSGGSR